MAEGLLKVKGRLGACAWTPLQLVKRFLALVLFNLLARTITGCQINETLGKKCMEIRAQMWLRRCNPVMNQAQFFLT